MELVRNTFEHGTVIKTNHVYANMLTCECWLHLKNANIIHAYREAPSVFGSLYYYMKIFNPSVRNLTLEEFTQSEKFIEHFSSSWAKLTASWLLLEKHAYTNHFRYAYDHYPSAQFSLSQRFDAPYRPNNSSTHVDSVGKFTGEGNSYTYTNANRFLALALRKQKDYLLQNISKHLFFCDSKVHIPSRSSCPHDLIRGYRVDW